MEAYRVLSVEEFWRRYDALESRLTAGLSERMLELAGLSPGQCVLDLASGRGEPALRAAARVGPHGHVLGVEPALPLVQMSSALPMPSPWKGSPKPTSTRSPSAGD